MANPDRGNVSDQGAQVDSANGSSNVEAQGNVVTPPPGFWRAMARSASLLMSRAGIASTLGYQFGGRRDLYMIYGYNRAPTWQDYWARYQRQDIASRIIDAPVDATWSPRPTFSNGKRITSAFTSLDQKINLYEAIARADKLAGIGRYSCLFLGLDDTTNLASPVSRTRTNNLMYVRALGEPSAKISKYYLDPSKETFGLPMMYEVDLGGIDANGERTTAQVNKQQVHADRMIHIVEQPMESPVFGTPRLLNVYNLLDDLMKVCGGSAEVFWLTSNRGMQADVDKDMTLSPADSEQLQDELEEYQHELRRVIRTRGVKLNPLTSQYPNPSNTFNMIVSMISGTTGIPQRILLGAEAGHLASDQDRANWADRIDDRRLKYAEPMILRALLRRLVDFKCIPNSPDLTIAWPSAYRLSPKEKDESSAQFARSVANMSRQPQYAQPIASTEECREKLGLPREVPTGETMPAFPIPSEASVNGTGGKNANSATPPSGTQGTGASGAGSTNKPAAGGKTAAKRATS